MKLRQKVSKKFIDTEIWYCANVMRTIIVEYCALLCQDIADILMIYRTL